VKIFPKQTIILLNGITQTYPNSDFCELNRAGNTVTVHVTGISLPANLPVDTVVFYAGGDYIPSKNCSLIMISSSNTVVRLSLYSNGAVQIKTANIAAGSYHIIGSYPI